MADQISALDKMEARTKEYTKRPCLTRSPDCTTGDEAIKCFAERTSKAIRGSDLAVRLGGDEFLLPECKPEDVQLVLGPFEWNEMDLDAQSISIASLRDGLPTSPMNRSKSC
jgi:hypothetical protein